MLFKKGRTLMLRPLVLATGMLSMATGTWLGLVRLGWHLPAPSTEHLAVHGPLMVCAFLGTLICLERAVALGSSRGYAAPLLSAASAVALGLSLPSLAAALSTAASVVLAAIFIVFWRRQRVLFLATMTAAAVAWVVGNALWLSGAPMLGSVFWWMVFLVLTIAGERLELNRLLRPTPVVRFAFVAAVGLVIVGVAASMRWPDAGVRVLGFGLLALAAWLVRHDVARRTVRQSGLTRYIAVGLLSGYGWLAFGGLLALRGGATTPGFVYDAVLHAVFLGFVMSMVFAHAPVIFPAVLGRPLPYHPRFYAHVVVLHVSLVLRMAGDLVPGLVALRAWGGMLNAVALVLFVANLVASVRRGS